MKPTVYVASSVTHSSEAHRQFITDFKEGLRLGSRALILEWIGKDVEVELDDFFKRNFNNVRRCDAMIAIVNEPSIGIGMEIQEALRLGKPLICLYQEDRTVSRLLRSAQTSAGLQLENYHDLYDALEIAVQFIDSLCRTIQIAGQPR